MPKKAIILDDKTRIIYNKARAKILNTDPSINRLTDELAVKIMAESYLKNG